MCSEQSPKLCKLSQLIINFSKNMFKYVNSLTNVFSPGLISDASKLENAERGSVRTSMIVTVNGIELYMSLYV